MRQDPADLLAHICSIDFFRQLDGTIQGELAACMERRVLAQDEYLFHQGDSGDDGMYIIIEGQLRVLVSQQDGSQVVVDEHYPGGFLGEIAMLTGSRRTASVQAVCQTEVAKISKAAFDRVVEKYPDVLSQICHQIVLHRLRRPQLFVTLKSYFGSLDQAAFEDVEAELSWLHLARGERLIRQGERDETLYLLVSGRLQAVAQDHNGHEQLVGDIEAGESVGEMHILTGEPRSATVYAIRDCELVKLSKEKFDRLVTRYPRMLRHITQLVIKRLQQTIYTPKAGRSNLAVDIVLVPASPEVPLADFTRRLAAAIEQYGSTLVLNSDTFDSYLAIPGAAQSPLDDPNDVRLTVWLNEQATHFKFRLFQTDFSVTSWTRRCLRQADQILIVGWSQSDPRLSEIESEVLAEDTQWGTAQKRLVLLHKASTQLPGGTTNWLKPRQFYRHHHIRWDHQIDLGRLARFLARRTVGLVFGSGGARGFAHIGVIRALEELGLEIDLIGGSSFGSMIGALYALEHNYESLHDQASQLANPKLISDYTLPITSLLTGTKFTNLMKELFHDLQIEDTWRKFFCVSSNLTKATQTVHQRGPLWKHIRSSCSIPLIFPPSIDNSDLLVDGGLINTLPLDVMKRIGEGGSIIGVDVSVDEDLSDNYQFDSSLSGWPVLWSRLNPLKSSIKTPSLLAILMRVAELHGSSHRVTQAALADLYIRPSVEKFGTLDWAAYEKIIEVGYRTALPQLEAWLRNQK